MSREKTAVVEASPELLAKLFLIGLMRNSAPATTTRFIDRPGLRVRLRTTEDSAKLVAGGRWRANLVVRFQRSSSDAPFDLAVVRKYVPGRWETLVDPVLDIAAWAFTPAALAGKVGSRTPLQRFDDEYGALALHGRLFLLDARQEEHLMRIIADVLVARATGSVEEHLDEIAKITDGVGNWKDLAGRITPEQAIRVVGSLVEHGYA